VADETYGFEVEGKPFVKTFAELLPRLAEQFEKSWYDGNDDAGNGAAGASEEVAEAESFMAFLTDDPTGDVHVTSHAHCLTVYVIAGILPEDITVEVGAQGLDMQDEEGESSAMWSWDQVASQHTTHTTKIKKVYHPHARTAPSPSPPTPCAP
jgi:hypothetical protein